MKYQVLKYIVCAAMLSILAWPVWAELPKRDLRVELRQVQESESTGYTVSTQPRNPMLAEQFIQVRNGEKASLNVGTSMPMQWVQSATAQSAMLAASGVSASNSGGSVTHAVTWMDAGQSIKVHPSWPGGKHVAVVEIEVQSASVQERLGAELPDQSHSQVVTTVNAPLGQWVTIAASGHGPQKGVYSSDAASQARQLLQIRVLAP